MSTQLQLTEQQVEIKTNLLVFISLFVALMAVSFAAIFMRVSEVEISANATVFNRFLIFTLCFGGGKVIYAGLGGKNESIITEEPFTNKQWILLFAVGIISTISLVLWALSLTETTVANSVLLNNLTPIFTSLGGWLFLRKTFDRRFLIGMFIALTGAIALGLEDLQINFDGFLGDALALLSAVFLGSYFLITEQLRDRFCATTILLWRCIIGCILLLPLILLAKEPIFPSSWSAWLAVIGLGLICEGLGQRLLADCMNKLSSGFISLFLLLEPIISAMLAWLIFAESLSLTSWLAFAVVLTGIYLAKSSKCAIKLVTESA